MVASNAIGAVADLDSRYPKPLDSMSVPEADTSNHRNGFIGGQLIEDLGQVRLCEIRWGHPRGLGSRSFRTQQRRAGGLYNSQPGFADERPARAAQYCGEASEVSPRPNLGQ